jgi:hypothetical protein
VTNHDSPFASILKVRPEWELICPWYPVIWEPNLLRQT